MRGLAIKSSFLILGVCLVGCETPGRLAKYPAGSLRVRYEEAGTYSTCLVASVAMAANYLMDERSFSEKGIIYDLQQAGRDETRIGDLKDYLAERGLHLVSLSGRLGDEPPTGLGYWLKKRGYPVICVINRDPVDPAFNHAVVVIGISENNKGDSADSIIYFDPSSVEPLHTSDVATFEELWARGQRAMMIVVVPPSK